MTDWRSNTESLSNTNGHLSIVQITFEKCSDQFLYSCEPWTKGILVLLANPLALLSRAWRHLVLVAGTSTIGAVLPRGGGFGRGLSPATCRTQLRSHPALRLEHALHQARQIDIGIQRRSVQRQPRGGNLNLGERFWISSCQLLDQMHGHHDDHT